MIIKNKEFRIEISKMSQSWTHHWSVNGQTELVHVLFFGHISVSFGKIELPWKAPLHMHSGKVQPLLLNNMTVHEWKCGKVLKTSLHTHTSTSCLPCVLLPRSKCFFYWHLFQWPSWFNYLSGHILTFSHEVKGLLSHLIHFTWVFKHQRESWPLHELNMVPSEPRGTVTLLFTAAEDQLGL